MAWRRGTGSGGSTTRCGSGRGRARPGDAACRSRGSAGDRAGIASPSDGEKVAGSPSPPQRHEAPQDGDAVVALPSVAQHGQSATLPGGWEQEQPLAGHAARFTPPGPWGPGGTWAATSEARKTIPARATRARLAACRMPARRSVGGAPTRSERLHPGMVSRWREMMCDGSVTTTAGPRVETTCPRGEEGSGGRGRLSETAERGFPRHQWRAPVVAESRPPTPDHRPRSSQYSSRYWSRSQGCTVQM